MSKKQTRRAISVAGLTYARLYRYCRNKGQSVSGYIERLVDTDLTAKGVPPETEPVELPTRPRKTEAQELAERQAGNVFTW